MKRITSTPGYLLLEDGTLFRGSEFYGSNPGLGEAVFNTSHSGYQEILTDPSYCRQILVFTAPHIGNTGINPDDGESDRIHAAGLITRSLVTKPSNYRAHLPLHDWFLETDRPILSGVDTRAITLHLRDHGAQRAGIFPSSVSHDEALETVRSSMDMSGADLSLEVTCPAAFPFDPVPHMNSEWHPALNLASGSSRRVAVLDFGVKLNILRELARRGCDLTVFPATTPAEQIRAGNFDGYLISNGPGDPAAVEHGIRCVQALLADQKPLFGICLGHQLLGLALGMRTFKLPFGHRGANHPVRFDPEGTIEITSQNHGFAVQPGDIPVGWRISHTNLNDGTVEGLTHEELPFFSIQYHPEASPGPHDSAPSFDRFVQTMHSGTSEKQSGSTVSKS